MAHIRRNFNGKIDDYLHDPWKLSSECLLTEEWIENNLNKINWNSVLLYQKLSEKFLRKHLNNIINFTDLYGKKNSFYYLVAYQKHSMEFLEELMIIAQFNSMHDIWRSVSYRQKLSDDFIRKFADKLCWAHLCHKQKLSESIMIDYDKYLNYSLISRYQNLTPMFIEQYFYKLNYEMLLKNKKLSLDAKKVILGKSHHVMSVLLNC